MCSACSSPLAYGYIAAYNPPRRSCHDRRPGHPAVHSRAQLPARRDAGHGRPVPRRQIGRRARLHPAHLHRPGLEHRLQLLLLAEIAFRANCAKPPRIYRFSRWQRFLQLELPFGAIGLVWNSMVSVAGGWFFLMACEMFVLGNARLPPARPRLVSANRRQRTATRAAILWGLAAMIGVIVLLDQLVWRPLIAWSDKFKFEQVESSSALPRLYPDRRHSIAIRLWRLLLSPIVNWITLYPGRRSAPRRRNILRSSHRPSRADCSAIFSRWLRLAWWLVALFHAAGFCAQITSGDFDRFAAKRGATFLRVNAALLSARLDHSRRRGHRLQPRLPASRSRWRKWRLPCPPRPFSR